MQNLETLIGRRFIDLDKLKNVLKTEFKAENPNVSEVDYSTKDEPKDWEEMDLMLDCSLNSEATNGEYGDFEIFYIKDRANRFYITEINPWGL